MSQLENLKYKGLIGECRHCEHVVAQKNRRNLNIGYVDSGGSFVVIVILVSASAFRCPRCHTRHKFYPFQTSQIV